MRLARIPKNKPLTPKQLAFLRARRSMANRCTELFDAEFTKRTSELKALCEMATWLVEGKVVVIKRKPGQRVGIGYLKTPSAKSLDEK